MGIDTLFTGMKVRPDQPEVARPRFSLTGDILSYRRCCRQYGYQSHEGFAPSQATQAFYGKVIHQVLDRCHRFFWGLDDPKSKGIIPSDDRIDSYFDEVANALIAHGERPYRDAVKETARAVLKTFNRLEGPTLYPRVVDTEYRLESDNDEYLLRGVADVIASSEGDEGGYEIWDYKSTEMPGLSSPELRDFQWQMCVYAELYRRKERVFPRKAVLYFLNELKLAKGQPPIKKRPVRALLELSFEGKEKVIADAMSAFDTTALEIMKCQLFRTWDAPTTPPDIKTCNACDLRWTCELRKRDFPEVRLPVAET